ncbi:uncharacterized protein LOC123542190 [Mercenaria mercenaria]|uniref:uncharacterized protein LOC123542190 n=1 Tax=Mercenaria mercenaria TaxID=6596 RepID=UPI00234F6D48|nr:uncharacterized protein LOC123542190 [Mercenaria mercenaria]
MEDSDGRSRNSAEADETENENQKESFENIKQTENKTSTFDFTEQSWRTDFVLIVEGTKLYVAKNILSLASPVFDTMFQSNFKESSCDELELPGKKLNDVIEFLRCIYPNTFTQITRDNAVTILPLIEEYQVVQLKPRCEAVLAESVNAETSVDDLFRLLREASMYDLKELREKCVSFASMKPHKELDEAAEKCALPSDAAKEIYEKVNKNLRETISNLEILVEEISAESKESNEKLKTTNAELTEELALMKQYLSAEVKNTKELKLDCDCYWQQKQFVLFIDMGSTCINAEKNVVLWDIPLTVLPFIKQKSGTEWLGIEIKNNGIKILCSVKAHAILVSRQPKGLNHASFFDESFGMSYFWGNTINMYLKPKSEVMDIKNGLMLDGKIGIIVQLFMSEPNKS